MLSFMKNASKVLLMVPVMAFVFAGTLVVTSLFGLYFGWLWVFRKLRKDPEVKFSIPVESWELAVAPEDSVEVAAVEKYLDELAQFLAKNSNANLSALTKTFTEIGPKHDARTADSKVIRFTSTIKNGSAMVNISLSLDAAPDGHGGYFFNRLLDKGEYDEEVDSLSSFAEISVLRTPSDPIFNFFINDDPIAAWFTIGVLRQTLDYNTNTKQAWAYIEEKDVWIVQYDRRGHDYGLRRKKTNKRARKLWFDF